MACSCCGAEATLFVTLPSRDDVDLCTSCIDWLAGRAGVTSTPTLPVVDLPQAVGFYERAGFGVRVYESTDETPSGFAFVNFEGRSVFDLDVQDIDPDRNGAGCYLIVADADAWHARMTNAGLPVTMVSDQPWGMREFALTDPSGNHVRIGHSTGG